MAKGYHQNVNLLCIWYLSQPHFGLSVRMKLTFPKVRTWSPPGLPKTQSLISGVKKPRIGVFLISLKRSWSLDVQNGLAWVIWTSAAQVMGKRRAASQTSSLTPDHKKSGIDPISTCVGGVQHGVEKLLKRATRLVWSSSRSKIKARSCDGPKSRKSKPRQFRDSFGTPLWESQDKEPFGRGRGGATQGIPGEGEEAATTSLIRIIQEEQGGR
jgi:hypothetical protein